MPGFVQAGPRRREPSTSQECTRHSLGRPRPILLLIAIAGFIRGVPRSRGWVLQVPQRETSSPLKRLYVSSRKGPPFRRRTLVTGQGVASEGLSLSTGPAVAADLSPQLVDTGWQGQTAIDPAAGFSLVKDGEGAVDLPACERELEGRGQQGFEGPEKTLEIEFDPDIGHEDGLRCIRREQWDAILEQVQTAEDASSRSGIRRVLPNATLQDHLFDPCGYSMNALEGRAYYTIHVTPESDFSYASFETNVRLPDYDDIVRGVLEVFRPKKFTMTLFAEKSGMEDIMQNPFDNNYINCAPTSTSSTTARYHRTVKTTTSFSGDYLSQMGNWVRASPEAVQSAALFVDSKSGCPDCPAV